MEEIEKRAMYCDLIVPKNMSKLIEKILRYYDMDFSHERFKAVIYSKDEFQTPLEEKMKNYYDAYLFLLMNHKSPFKLQLFENTIILFLKKSWRNL